MSTSTSAVPAVSDAVSTVIYAEYDNGLTRDQIIVLLVTEHAMSLNLATKAYAATAKFYGWTAALTSHKDAALIRIEDQFGDAIMVAADIKSLVIDLMDEFEVADSTARDYIKAWCADRQDYPVENPREAIFAWFIDHATTATKDGFMDFAVQDLGRSQSNANEYWKGYELHLAIVAAS
jgi:hypothetical protein